MGKLRTSSAGRGPVEEHPDFVELGEIAAQSESSDQGSKEGSEAEPSDRQPRDVPHPPLLDPPPPSHGQHLVHYPSPQFPSMTLSRSSSSPAPSPLLHQLAALRRSHSYREPGQPIPALVLPDKPPPHPPVAHPTNDVPTTSADTGRQGLLYKSRTQPLLSVSRRSVPQPESHPNALEEGKEEEEAKRPQGRFMNLRPEPLHPISGDEGEGEKDDDECASPTSFEANSPAGKYAMSVMKGRLSALRAMRHMKIDMDLVPPQTPREKLYCLLDPTVAAWADWAGHVQTGISIFIFFLIIVSVAVFCIESLPSYYEQRILALQILEGICVGFFTIEFSVKIVCVKNKKKFMKDFLNWIDFVSIIPYYIELILDAVSGGGARGAGSLIILRVVRLIRVFRVLKLSKYSANLQLVAVAVARSVDALCLLLFLILITCLMFASAMFMAEQASATFNETQKAWMIEVDGEMIQSDFQSIPHAFWWCIVTLTTVGYGDNYPRTVYGKIVAVFTMLGGILVVAFPVILIGNNFDEAVREHKERTKRHTEMIQAALGALESSKTDDPPTLEICQHEIRNQLEVFHGDLVRELRRLGLKVHIPAPRSPYGSPPLGVAGGVFARGCFRRVVHLVSLGVQLPTPSLNTTSKPGTTAHRIAALLAADRRARSADPGVTYQFRYTPALEVLDTTVSTSGHLPKFLHIQVSLDSPESQAAALAALHPMYPHTQAGNVRAREVSHISCTVPHLQDLLPEASVNCSYNRPPDDIRVAIQVSSTESLDLLLSILPSLQLEFDIMYMYPCPGLPLHQLVTVPLLKLPMIEPTTPVGRSPTVSSAPSLPGVGLRQHGIRSVSPDTKRKISPLADSGSLDIMITPATSAADPTS
eukprot:Sspe_Gene.80200::Locus_50493_Transcript_1_1_Confidence_1.000_Length_2890::g.80200::m.80200